jgi:hypothetical protein
MRVHPRHRGDCADLFSTPEQTARIELDAPDSTISEIEHAAARTGRTWNAQLIYVLSLCLGYHPPDFTDGRSVEDWRTLLSPCNFRFSDSDAWRPFTCLWWKPYRKGGDA